MPKYSNLLSIAPSNWLTNTETNCTFFSFSFFFQVLWENCQIVHVLNQICKNIKIRKAQGIWIINITFVSGDPYCMSNSDIIFIKELLWKGQGKYFLTQYYRLKASSKNLRYYLFEKSFKVVYNKLHSCPKTWESTVKLGWPGGANHSLTHTLKSNSKHIGIIAQPALPTWRFTCRSRLLWNRLQQVKNLLDRCHTMGLLFICLSATALFFPSNLPVSCHSESLWAFSMTKNNLRD